MWAYSISCRLMLPRDMVYGYAADPANAAKWLPGVESWALQDGATELSEGAAIVETRAPGNGPRTRRYTVDSVLEPERFAVRTVRRGLAYIYDFAFVPLSAGSLVIMNGKVEATTPLLRWFEVVALEWARREDRHLPERLKTALEGSWTPVV